MRGKRTTAPRRGTSSTEAAVPRFVDASSRRRRTAATPPRPTLRDRVRDGMPEEKEVRALLSDSNADVGITARLALRRIVARRLLGEVDLDAAILDADRAWTTVVDRIRAAAPLTTRDRASILADVASGAITPEDADDLLARSSTPPVDVPDSSAALVAMLRTPSAVTTYAEKTALQLHALRMRGDLADEDLDDRVTAAWDHIREAVLGLEVLS